MIAMLVIRSLLSIGILLTFNSSAHLGSADRFVDFKAVLDGDIPPVKTFLLPEQLAVKINLRRAVSYDLEVNQKNLGIRNVVIAIDERANESSVQEPVSLLRVVLREFHPNPVIPVRSRAQKIELVNETLTSITGFLDWRGKRIRTNSLGDRIMQIDCSDLDVGLNRLDAEGNLSISLSLFYWDAGFAGVTDDDGNLSIPLRCLDNAKDFFVFHPMVDRVKDFALQQVPLVSNKPIVDFRKLQLQDWTETHLLIKPQVFQGRSANNN